jgi:hypothetical protein
MAGLYGRFDGTVTTRTTAEKMTVEPEAQALLSASGSALR